MKKSVFEVEFDFYKMLHPSPPNSQTKFYYTEKAVNLENTTQIKEQNSKKIVENCYQSTVKPQTSHLTLD